MRLCKYIDRSCRFFLAPSNRWLPLNNTSWKTSLSPYSSVVLNGLQLPEMNKNQSLRNEKSYDDAIQMLNGLQPTAAAIDDIRKRKKRTGTLSEVLEFMGRLEVNISDMDKLNIIHVSGTKGKGSVSAFCESILRNCGLTTGLNCSPHLVEVRERIQLNGKPLSKEKFAKYFFECYERLVKTADSYDGKLPNYPRFMTLMAFYTFLQEKPDVVVLEVGIGGSYDCTNIIRHPVVCGICKLEIDHSAILGNTIEEIAWHKAGIMKPTHPAFTLRQVENASKVLFKRAEELKTTLHEIPLLDSYSQNLSDLHLSTEPKKVNAALALQLCRMWFYKNPSYASSSSLLQLTKQNPLPSDGSSIAKTFHLPECFIKGLNETNLYGRCQVIKRKNITFYLDGAHTTGSVEACVDWFKSRQDKDVTMARDHIFRVMVFNLSGNRNEVPMLTSLSEIDFDYAIFCPNILEDNSDTETSPDLKNLMFNKESRSRMCQKNYNTWMSIKESSNIQLVGSEPDVTVSPSDIASVFPSIGSSIRWIANGKDVAIEKEMFTRLACPERSNTSIHAQVLVVGSLHLVGGVLKFLGPEISQMTY